MNATMTCDWTDVGADEFRFLAFGDESGLEAVVCRWLTEANLTAFWAAERAHRRLALAVLGR